MASHDRDIEQALTQLDKLIGSADDAHGEERNEAATRFDLIDGLLLNVLRWPREQVRPEEHSAAGYADYVLGRPQRQGVVEAKREGKTFRLPPETPRQASLETLFTLDPELKAAVEQVLGYAAAFGLPYAAVANGRQLVAFLANRIDGVEPLKGRALAFHSLEDMKDGFADLWDGLSRPGVESRRLSAMLRDPSSPAPPPKGSTLIPSYPAAARSSQFIGDLRMLAELFLVDLVDSRGVSEEFLRECYLNSGALSQYATVSRTILKSRYPEALEQDLEVQIESARTRKGVPQSLLSDVAAASLSARPIILLGYVGVGKTMFIRHLVRVDAKALLSDAIVLYVDLGSEPALEELEPFIAERFIEDLAANHGRKIFESEYARRVYKQELAEFEKGPWGELADSHPEQYRLKEVEHLASRLEDRQTHLRRSLQYLAEVERRQIVTILDNVDQRPAEVQDRVFVISETLAKSWPGTVFIALRPDTFNRSRRSGALAAYQPRVFAVEPPRIDRVLEKRMEYARKQIAAPEALPPGLDALSNTEALDSYLEVIRLSLRRSQALLELVDNVSGQNARRAIELLTTVVGSPHAHPQKTIDRAKDGHYNIPFHEFLRAVMLGDRAHYDPASSHIPNLLDMSTDDGREHFLLPMCLSALQRMSEPGVQDGFVSAQRVYEYAQDLGFRPEQVTWQLERAIAAGAVEPSPIDGSPDRYRATPLGSYVEKRLLGDFTYLDEVSIDTPIVDNSTRALTQEAEKTSERIERTYRFVKYLDDQWQKLADLDSNFDWAAQSAAVYSAITEVEARLESASSQRRKSGDTSRGRQAGRGGRKR